MDAQSAYFLTEAAENRTAAVFSSPHSGSEYPEDLLMRSRLGSHALRASEDAFVDDLFALAPHWGGALIAARMPRAYVDLNRGPEELDPAVVRDVRATGLNPRIAAGLGVVPRIVAAGQPIYSGKSSLEEARHRIATWHNTYHQPLSQFLAGDRPDQAVSGLRFC